MTGSKAERRGGRTIGVVIIAVVAVAGAIGVYWHNTRAVAQDAAATNLTVQPVSYPVPGKDPQARTEFPAGATPVTGPDIVAALSDHTALLPGGFVEYYAPDGTIHGLAEEKHYGGSWEVRNGDFCTLLQGSTDSVCSPVERKDNTLYWSMDGDPEASPVSTIPGNPKNLP
jgi:hypothetical protein